MIQIEVIGNLGADAEVAEINGQYYARFNVGVNRQSGNGDKVTTWVNCSKAVTPLGNLTQYLKKGRQVYVRGNLSVSAYTNKNGAAIPTVSCRVDFLKLLGNERK